MYLAEINTRLLCLYYHLNCRHINDNPGDIKLDEMLISQKTFKACFYIKSHQNDANKRDL